MGAHRRAGCMSDSGQNTGGLMSSAGLVRYFDSEDNNAIRMDPKSVMAFGVLLGAFVQTLTIVY
jgi:preprotein translocase subunit Sec61beta